MTSGNFYSQSVHAAEDQVCVTNDASVFLFYFFSAEQAPNSKNQILRLHHHSQTIA